MGLFDGFRNSGQVKSGQITLGLADAFAAIMLLVVAAE